MISTLIVKVPCRDPNRQDHGWSARLLPFVLLNADGTVEYSGQAPLDRLPRASETLILLAAPDVLFISAALPPLRGQRLRQALPHLVEEHLLSEVEQCHIALDPEPADEGRHTLAVVDRGWLRSLLDTFATAGHTRVKVLPLSRCLPRLGVESVLPSQRVVVFPGTTFDATPDADTVHENSVELLWIDAQRAQLAAGWQVPLSELQTTLATLVSAGDVASVVVQHIVLPGDTPPSTTDASYEGTSGTDTSLAFTDIAHHAPMCRFNLCQFDFSRRAWPCAGELIKRCRTPLLLVALTAMLNLAAINLHWAWLCHRRDSLLQQQVHLLLKTFPDTTVVLNPAQQMTQQLDAKRRLAGEPVPDSLIALCDSLSQSLGAIPVQSIRRLDYQASQLTVTFDPSTTIDSGFADRLKHAGVQGEPTSISDTSTDIAAGTVSQASAVPTDDTSPAAPLRWTLRKSKP